jgi:NADPH:quinone reductase-like Zn-dependent oxidoreductase
MTISTQAWVLYAKHLDSNSDQNDTIAQLREEEYDFSEIEDHEALVKPIYGCWEANMGHAISRDPLDVCQFRGEDKVVIGNSGVVQVLQTGKLVSHVKEGDYAIIIPVAYGDDERTNLFPKAYAYDSKGSVGLLAKQTKLPAHILGLIPKNTAYSLKQWAAFSLRYPSAWANWRMAIGARRLHTTESEEPSPFVWAWGGGVAFAELALAKHAGCQPFMVASKPERLNFLQKAGIQGIDRSQFPDLFYDKARYESDKVYRRAYILSETRFLKQVKALTNGAGVSLFIDNIGEPVIKVSLASLGLGGVLTTCGWKEGVSVPVNRARECIRYHTHVHTHGSHISYAMDAMAFGEKHGWMPPLDENEKIYTWDEIPALSNAYSENTISSYFPLFKINEE